ncbi:MAG TPA: hypothetical protein VFH83_12355, partial [Spirochaetia bacterium]|nr:hypothetical protein [Spirochaetia bacterium]
RLPQDIDTDTLLDYLDKKWDAQGTYLQAYGLYVLSAYGRQETAKAILTRLKSFLRPGTRTVTLVGTVNDRLWYGGDVQAKSLLLMLYSKLQPDSQLVLGLANDLLSGNRAGSWGNTSNAGWVLQAFAEMIAAGGEENADFTASVKLGNAVIASNPFKGMSTTPFTAKLDAPKLADTAASQQGPAVPGGKQLPLTFAVDGTGTLYYTAEMRYALATDQVDARDEGLGLGMDLLDETGAPVEGTNLVLGSVYQMRIVFYSSKDRTYLAIRAPIPSGAEPIDGSLVTSQTPKPQAEDQSDQTDQAGDQGNVPPDYGYTGPSTRIYDSEVRFFFDELPRGRHQVTFTFRCTTPGVFPTPPVQAELMYQPEVFGRTAGATYTIAPASDQ